MSIHGIMRVEVTDELIDALDEAASQLEQRENEQPHTNFRSALLEVETLLLQARVLRRATQRKTA